MNLTRKDFTEIAGFAALKFETLRSFVEVESGGVGFKDGRIVIQFEPHIFARYLTQKGIEHTLNKALVNGKTVYTINVPKVGSLVANGKSDKGIAAGSWHIINGVEGQDAEYRAFSIAMAIEPTSALLSASVGLGQIMGFNFSALKYRSVNDMWDDFKVSEYNQVMGIVKFIKANPALLKALKQLQEAKTDEERLSRCRIIATYYNGSNYAAGNYHVKILNAYNKWRNSHEQ